MLIKRARKVFPFLLAFPLVIVFFNEYLIYYLSFLWCKWPENQRTNVMIIADTHLLGVFRGHWFDKLRREWQMYRSFQTAVALLKPKAVFFLGDLFDEGLLGRDEIFFSYVKRFNELFTTDDKIKRYVVMGNHDIGFHNEIFPQRLFRFTANFDVSRTVDHIEIDGNIFVLLNSMALEGDYCYLCANAVDEIERLSRLLNCTQNFEKANCAQRLSVSYSQPIVMQHFPLYRRSDMECDDTDDVAPSNVRKQKFKSKHDCISKASTSFIIEKLRPRAVFGGHIHYGCRKWWKAPNSFWEYSVPSFSWRNNHRPSFILASISPETLGISNCFIPDEYLIIAIYVITICIWLGILIISIFPRSRIRRLYLYGFRGFRMHEKT